MSDEAKKEEGIVLIEGFEDAYLGLAYDQSVDQHRAVYAFGKIIKTLTEVRGLSEEEAFDYFDEHLAGIEDKQAPLYLMNVPLDKIDEFEQQFHEGSEGDGNEDNDDED